LYALLAALILLLLCPARSPARAGAIGAVNHARAAACGSPRTAGKALTASARLDEVARLLARGAPLERAEQHAGYPAARALWIRVTGAAGDAGIERIISRQFCSQIRDPRLRQIGIYRDGRSDLWIVVAQPLIIPSRQDAGAVSRQVLALTNRARAHARTCGRRRFPPAPPLTLSAALSRAARAHARDMAAHGFFGHAGSDGSSPAERVTRTGYRWSMVGENIASGVPTARAAVAGWLASPHHCANIMTAGFQQLGVAFAVNPANPLAIDWTEDFGTPR
jgi:uncharacterized protein YkwD